MVDLFLSCRKLYSAQAKKFRLILKASIVIKNRLDIVYHVFFASSEAVSVKDVLGSLRDNAIVCFPTETLYALACNAYSFDAIKMLYALKNRPLDKPFCLLLSSVEQISLFTNLDNTDRNILKKLLPGPITVILPLQNTQNLPRVFFRETIGIRIPNHQIALEILTNFNSPIVATSANITGHAGSSKADEIPMSIKKGVAAFIENDTSVSGICSTIFELRSRRILRQGMVSEQEIYNVVRACS